MNIVRRVAFLSEHASPLAPLGGEDAGGQNVYIDELSRSLAQRGYAVDVFTRRDAPELPDVVDLAPGVRVVHLTAGPPRSLGKDALWPLMPRFRDAFLQFDAAQDGRYDVIHGNFWMSGWVATELRRRLAVPAVQIFHALGKTKLRHQGANDTSPARRIEVELDVVRKIDRVIAVCPSEQDELIQDYEADSRKIGVVPLAVNTQTFRPMPQAEARARIGFTSYGGPLVVYVGRVIPRKDIGNIVRAIALLERRRVEGYPATESPVNLLIVGGETPAPDPVATPEIGELQRLASELGVAHLVHFAGRHQPEELRYFYSAGDVAVTTPWYEPFGLTPLEAMACGRPVVGSAVGGIPFTVRDGETGCLVPPRNPEAACRSAALATCASGPTPPDGPCRAHLRSA